MESTADPRNWYERELEDWREIGGGDISEICDAEEELTVLDERDFFTDGRVDSDDSITGYSLSS